MSLRYGSWFAAVATVVLCTFSGVALGQQPAVVVSPTSLTIEVGSTAQYTLSLTVQPTAEMAVIPSSSDEMIATFTTDAFNDEPVWSNGDNRDFAYTVTVTGVAVGSTTITHRLDSGAGNYPNSITIADVTVTVAPRFPIAAASSVTGADKTAAGTQVGEDVGNAAFTVSVSGEAPTDDITVQWAVTGAGTDPDAPALVPITIREDDPAERQAQRQARVMALGTVTNQAVERLGAGIIRGRLTRGGAARPPGDVRSLTVAGRRISAARPWAANPRQRAALPAQAPATADGGAMTMAEMLNTSAFSLSSVNDTLTIWGAGGRTSVSGTIPATATGSSTTYDGDNTAFHIGAESWVRDAVLAGVTLGYTVGDLDWTAGSQSGKIRSAMTSVHPYWARWISDATSLWLSLGYGTSNLKYTEDSATAAPKLTAMMASGGLSSRSDVFDAADVALNINVAWVSSDLGSATLSNGALLDGSHSTAVRLGSSWEFGYTMDTPGGELRLFATAGARKDYKDASDAIAYELGGGFQWTDNQGLNFSLETTRQLDGSARYEENHISARLALDTAWQGFGLAPFTRMAMDASGDRTLAGGLSVRAGQRLTLSLETALSDANRADYRNLFSGEWRF